MLPSRQGSYGLVEAVRRQRYVERGLDDERSLQRYYERQFRLSKPQAARLARWVVDLGYRGNFVFGSNGEYDRCDGVNTNPWGQP